MGLPLPGHPAPQRQPACPRLLSPRNVRGLGASGGAGGRAAPPSARSASKGLPAKEQGQSGASRPWAPSPPAPPSCQPLPPQQAELESCYSQGALPDPVMSLASWGVSCLQLLLLSPASDSSLRATGLLVPPPLQEPLVGLCGKELGRQLPGSGWASQPDGGWHQRRAAGHCWGSCTTEPAERMRLLLLLGPLPPCPRIPRQASVCTKDGMLILPPPQPPPQVPPSSPHQASPARLALPCPAPLQHSLTTLQGGEQLLGAPLQQSHAVVGRPH